MYISDSGAFILFSNREKILSPQIYLYFSIPYNYLMLKKSQTVFDLNYFKCNHFLEVAIKVALQIAPELVLMSWTCTLYMGLFEEELFNNPLFE